jgi:hypothetical protein
MDYPTSSRLASRLDLRLHVTHRNKGNETDVKSDYLTQRMKFWNKGARELLNECLGGGLEIPVIGFIVWWLNLVAEERKTSTRRRAETYGSDICCTLVFLVRLISDPENGSDTFLRNISPYTDYTRRNIPQNGNINLRVATTPVV